MTGATAWAECRLLERLKSPTEEGLTNYPAVVATSSATGSALGLLSASLQTSLAFSIIHSLPFNFLCLYYLRREKNTSFVLISSPKGMPF